MNNLNWKEFGRERLWPNWIFILDYFWRYLGKPWTILLRIIDVPAESRTKAFPSHNIITYRRIPVKFFHPFYFFFICFLFSLLSPAEFLINLLFIILFVFVLFYLLLFFLFLHLSSFLLFLSLSFLSFSFFCWLYFFLFSSANLFLLITDTSIWLAQPVTLLTCIMTAWLWYRLLWMRCFVAFLSLISKIPW